jgi:hypothetical protein
LVIFRGGYMCVELKRRASAAPADSLKYFISGLAQQPVLYVFRESEERPGNIQHPTPFLVPWTDFLGELIGDKECFYKHVERLAEERKRLFSLDNFLRLLLVYGSTRCLRRLAGVPCFREAL